MLTNMKMLYGISEYSHDANTPAKRISAVELPLITFTVITLFA